MAETRRRWSQAEKLAIVKEACAPNTNVSAVARRHGIKPSLLFRWKKQYGATAGCEPAGPAFVPLALPVPAASAAFPDTFNGIEIGLRKGRRVRLGAGADLTALKRILDILED